MSIISFCCPKINKKILPTAQIYFWTDFVVPFGTIKKILFWPPTSAHQLHTDILVKYQQKLIYWLINKKSPEFRVVPQKNFLILIYDWTVGLHTRTAQSLYEIVYLGGTELFV